jgi:hypothetical protein
VCEAASYNATSCETFSRVLVDYYYDEELRDLFLGEANSMINDEIMDIAIARLDVMFA